MGFGVSLTFIAIGAILAFATHVDMSGISLQAIGWILMAVGVVSMIVTFAYTRPRRRGRVTEVIEEDPADVARSGETEPKTYLHPAPDDPIPPTRRGGRTIRR